ncbi:MAG: crossover junction endodeoxyribonuclease RuvC [Bacteroidales bacterium]|nr:crossover junction endodeoxyribonuclease RuvC [Bacteroidales bacterium]
MIIIGVDPGTNMLGYSIVDTSENKPTIVVSGKLNLSKVENPYSKLEKIYEKITSLVKEYSPETMSIEAPFFGKNVQSMLKLGRAQGVAIAAAFGQGVEVFEYSPRKIKQSITGNGNASKDQVAQMIKSILNLKTLPDSFDETDAIAAALCHFYQNSKVSTKKSYNGWKDFISQNPTKLK